MRRAGPRGGWQCLGRIVWREVEQHDVVGRVAIGRDLAWLEEVRDDARHVFRLGDVAHRGRRAELECGRAGFEVRAREDHDEGGRRRAELGLEECLRPGRFEVVADEATRAEGARRLRGERQGEDDQQAPRADDEAGAAHDETAESIEGVHAAIVLFVALTTI